MTKRRLGDRPENGITRRGGRTYYQGARLPPGPYDDEPDELDLEVDGLPVRLERNDQGAWCGYVGVGSDHPWFGLGYESVEESWQLAETPAPADAPAPTHVVHCGLTLSQHRGDPGTWWLGFDCAHTGSVDVTPACLSGQGCGPNPRGHYRTLLYAAVECRRLVHAVRRAARPAS